LTAWVAAVAAAQLVPLLATSTRYGYHRDEMYFIVAGSHPAFGYPDQPPLVPLLANAMNRLDPGSLFLLRLPSALAAVATTVIAALVAREVGGGRRAQLIAAGCTAASGVALAVGHFVTTTTFDLLSTTAVGWLVLRGVVRGGGPSMLAAGIVVGLGCEAKPQVGLVAVVLVAVLLAIGPREPLRSWWTAGGVAAAVAIVAPYAVWQQLHGWPQLTVARNIGGSAEGGRAGFIPFQLVMVSPVLVPVWVAGLLAPFRRPAWRPFRFLPITYASLAVLYLVGDGKAYYLASLYPALLGLGAIPTADWTRTQLRLGLVTAAILVSTAVSALIALPLLPERSLEGSAVMALNPDQGETVGWPRFADTVARAWRSIPPAERRRTAIFTSNYGEAGAVDLLGRSRGLPQAYSGHNGFSLWGRPPDSDTSALLIGYSARGAAPEFTGCRRLATIDNGVGLDNDEQGGAVLLCGTAAPWSVLWPELRHYQ
jgi:4-amino-4-deoxy-L-arabinose transferase-like glycosyltransferase